MEGHPLLMPAMPLHRYDDGFDNSINLPSNIVYKMQLERFEVFKAQDHEKGHFDCIIEIDGKEIHVHNYYLASASETFNSLISDRWNKGNDKVIKIENPEYSYNNFYQFLTFIYSGNCSITKENAYILINMSEYYGVECLKFKCDEFLSKNAEMNFETLEEMIDFAQKYSLERFLAALKRYFCSQYMNIMVSPYFLEFKKPFMEYFSTFTESRTEKAFFDAVYKWAEHQAAIKKNESKDANFDEKGFMKAEMDGILSNIDFSKIRLEIVKEIINEKRFLFSANRLYEIVSNCKKDTSEEGECFKILSELAETEAKEKQKISRDANFDLNQAVKKELGKILPKIKFNNMSFEFLMKFVDFSVEKGFIFSLKDFYKTITKKHQHTVYRLAEKQVLIEQKETPNSDVNVIEAVKEKLAEVWPKIEYSKMSVTFLKENLVQKGFFLTPSELCKFMENHSAFYSLSNEEKFKAIYELARTQVLAKHIFSVDKNFDFVEEVKHELSEVISKTKFCVFSNQFLMDFVVAKKIISEEQANHILDVCVEFKTDNKTINGVFKDFYGIMKTFSSPEYLYFPNAWNKLRCSNLKFKFPTTPSPISKMKGDEWFLCFEKDSTQILSENDAILTVKHQSLVSRNDFLIAEMKSKSADFKFDSNKPAWLSMSYKNV